MQHRGEIVEKAVRQSGMPLKQLAKRLGKSRRWIYNAFENPSLSLDLINEIGKIIDLKNTVPTVNDGTDLLYQPAENSAEFWKHKYLILLEKYNVLLEGRGGLGTS